MAGALPFRGALPHGLVRASESWNVLFLCVDELSLRDLQLVHAPNIQRVANEGVDCTSAYCAAPVCAPTRGSWLTGLYPSEHGVLSNSYVLDADIPTLVEVFRDAGYTTACYGKVHSNNTAVESSGAGYGFSTLVNQNSPDWSAIRSTYRDPDAFKSFYDTVDTEVFNSIASVHKKQFGSQIVHMSNHGDYVATRLAMDFLSDHAADSAPFFLYMSLVAPHQPYSVPLLSTDPSSSTWYYNYLARRGMLVERLAGARTDSPAWVKSNAEWNDWTSLEKGPRGLLIAKYFCYLEFVDYLIGLVLAQVDGLGLGSNTLVVFMSDHGEQNGHRGIFLKDTCFLETSQVPLRFRMPGVLDASSSYGGLISTVDVLPTVAGLVGIGSSVGGVSGMDLSGALCGTSGATERETVFIGDDFSAKTLQASMLGIIDSDGGMTVSYGSFFKAKGYISDTGVYEVYRLAEDPDQETNLLGDSSVAGIVADHEDREAEFYDGLAALAVPLATI